MSLVLELLPWALSAMTIAVMWLAGSKNPFAWRLSIVNQALWSLWIISAEAWGLLPMNLAMYVVAIRSLLRWERRQKFDPVVAHRIDYTANPGPVIREVRFSEMYGRPEP